ncbi:SDR family NAD(P)-dependent oxidoreductase [Arthrobacter terricola]|uniref:SDR family NAD(P)-dependent oxidoreductase n=2 Tax=Arthrobacter TaxID=1663 RepID=UPI001F2F207A|nr:SDR family NAD(P)-dependent oxidoreductase [Arthrobacter terricola]
MIPSRRSSTIAAPALVTGASSGIGRAFAERLAADGHDLIVVGRRRDRLDALAASLPGVDVQVIAVDLASDEGIAEVVATLAERPVSILINNAGVAHYMPFSDLPPGKAREIVYVKTLAPTLLSRAALPGMLAAGAGTIVNVAGMLAFSGPTDAAQPQGQRAAYVASLAGTVAMSQVLGAELANTGVTVHAVCPGIVATEFHEVQGMDLSVVLRMSAEDVVTAALAGVALGETVIAPGVEDAGLLETIFAADRAAFHGQAPTLATRYTQGDV